MHDRVAALERAADRGGVEDVAGDDVVGLEGEAVRRERLGHLLRAADEEPDLVAVTPQGDDEVGADVPGATGDEDAHGGSSHGPVRCTVGLVTSGYTDGADRAMISAVFEQTTDAALGRHLASFG